MKLFHSAQSEAIIANHLITMILSLWTAFLYDVSRCGVSSMANKRR